MAKTKPGAESAKVLKEVQDSKAKGQPTQSQARKAQPTPANREWGARRVRCKAKARPASQERRGATSEKEEEERVKISFSVFFGEIENKGYIKGK